MNRRTFLAGCVAAVAAMLTPAAQAVGLDTPERVDVLWFKMFAPHDGDTGYIEAKFRVNGGPWRTRRAVIRKPNTMMALTANCSIGFSEAWK